jgi:hypothetical protein
VVAVIEFIVVGIVFIAVAAIVVGIVDARRADRWRQVAEERRREWEERALELHGGAWPSTANDDWDDD